MTTIQPKHPMENSSRSPSAITSVSRLYSSSNFAASDSKALHALSRHVCLFFLFGRFEIEGYMQHPINDTQKTCNWLQFESNHANWNSNKWLWQGTLKPFLQLRSSSSDPFGETSAYQFFGAQNHSAWWKPPWIGKPDHAAPHCSSQWIYINLTWFLELNWYMFMHCILDGFPNIVSTKKQVL